MTKEELEIDNKRLDFNEKVQLVVKKEELKEQDIRLNKLCFDYQEKEKRIAELEHQLAHRNCLDCSNHSSKLRMRTLELEKENAELRKVAEFQQSSNMSRHFENKKLKEGLVVGSTFNKALNSMNKNLEEERDKYKARCEHYERCIMQMREENEN